MLFRIAKRARSRRLLTVLAAAGALAVVVVVATRWQDIAAWVRFYRLFEPIGKNAQGYPEYRHRQTGIVMVRVPGGTFMMGTSEEEANRLATAYPKDLHGGSFVLGLAESEQPQHQVMLGSFLIGKYEVTRAEWQKVMGEGPSKFEGENLPVEQVSWEDCKEFSRTTGLYLPTEAQWEHSCRAGGRAWPFVGTGNINDMGWYGPNSDGTAHPVGQKQPNAFGLFDMHGNVWEWCSDVYDEGFYSNPEALDPDPVAVSGSDNRVVRGGSWYDGAWHCRSAFRLSSPSRRSSRVGLRVAFYPLPPGL